MLEQALELSIVERYGFNPIFVRSNILKFMKFANAGDSILEEQIDILIKNKPKPFVKLVLNNI